MVTEAQVRILNIIPFGKENAISRELLKTYTDMSDRKIRQIIHELRISGQIICSDSGCKGYWRPTKRKEVEDFIEQMESYGKQCFLASKSARQYMLSHEDQLAGV